MGIGIQEKVLDKLSREMAAEDGPFEDRDNFRG